MDYKAYPEGGYIVSFDAKDLPAIVRMVKLNELWRKENQEAVLKKVEEAEKEL